MKILGYSLSLTIFIANNDFLGLKNIIKQFANLFSKKKKKPKF